MVIGLIDSMRSHCYKRKIITEVLFLGKHGTLKLQFRKRWPTWLHHLRIKLLKKFIPIALKKSWRTHRKFGIIREAIQKSSLGRLREMYQVETGLWTHSSLCKILLDSKCKAENFLYVEVQNKGDPDWFGPIYLNHYTWDRRCERWRREP